MSWTDQIPEATDVILAGFIVTGSERRVHFEIDRLNHSTPSDGHFYRATVGNLFGSEEIARGKDLDQVLRWLTIKASEA